MIARRTAGAARAMANPVIRRVWELGSPALLFSCPRDEGAFLGNLKPRILPLGRAQHVDRRRSVRLVQTPVVPATNVRVRMLRQSNEGSPMGTVRAADAR